VEEEAALGSRNGSGPEIDRIRGERCFGTVAAEDDLDIDAFTAGGLLKDLDVKARGRALGTEIPPGDAVAETDANALRRLPGQ
jgi:hypothetical protein